MEPVIVAGLARIRSEAVDIQYPPEAATLPMETTIGLPALRVIAHSRRITSEAKALPPGESTLSTIALTLSSMRALRISAAVESPPIAPGGRVPS